MALRLITATERLAETERKVSIAIAGRAKVGKTSLLLTLPAPCGRALAYEDKRRDIS